MQITHHPDRNRFETILQGETAYMEYVPFEGGINLIHTIVPSPLSGKGVASELTRHVLEYAREQQLRVVPTCSFVRVYVERHPEYKVLI